ncbi:hypothetical protein [Methanogenium cariaci]|uniref:hypothetical protein n=1 Tax=Methanogenium cariaci TaxID=2197 RepID=UPI0012F6D83C|nr:hypothetical protein [Methanogenium cariaci]
MKGGVAFASRPRAGTDVGGNVVTSQLFSRHPTMIDTLYPPFHPLLSDVTDRYPDEVR